MPSSGMLGEGLPELGVELYRVLTPQTLSRGVAMCTVISVSYAYGLIDETRHAIVLRSCECEKL